MVYSIFDNKIEEYLLDNIKEVGIIKICKEYTGNKKCIRCNCIQDFFLCKNCIPTIKFKKEDDIVQIINFQSIYSSWHSYKCSICLKKLKICKTIINSRLYFCEKHVNEIQEYYNIQNLDQFVNEYF